MANSNVNVNISTGKQYLDQTGLAKFWGLIKGKLDKKLDDTTTYAASTTVGGSAVSAAKLDTVTAGSATKPVYFDNGVPVEGTYTIESNVPSTAIWTNATTTEAGYMSAEDKGILDTLNTNMGNYALKSDLVEVYKYKGSVDTPDALPTTDNVNGNIYNVSSNGMNYAWVEDNAETKEGHWDALGQFYEISSIEDSAIITLVNGSAE